MPQANQLDITTIDAFWRNFNEAEAEAAAEKEPPLVAEAKVSASVENAVTFSRDVWAKPASQRRSAIQGSRLHPPQRNIP